MSDYASVAERARRAQASVSRLERALRDDPGSASLRINLSAKRKLAEQMKQRLSDIAEDSGVDVCDYRIVPRHSDILSVSHISDSLLQYQLTFSQVFDALKNGRKQRAVLSRDAEKESQLSIGYTYSGSFGIVMLAPGKRDFYNGAYDETIDAFYQLLSMTDTWQVRDAARVLGEAVVKRFHDWSAANVAGHFDVDVQWSRSDGRRLGRVVAYSEMAHFVEMIGSASDEETREINIDGFLVGIDYRADTFHIAVPNGETFKGQLADTFHKAQVQVPALYACSLVERVTIHYATGKETRRHELVRLAKVATG